MVVGYVRGAKSLAEVFDRLLNKGIVVDAWYRVCPLGIDLGMTMEARMVVISINTYLKHTEFTLGVHLGQVVSGFQQKCPPKTQHKRLKEQTEELGSQEKECVTCR